MKRLTIFLLALTLTWIGANAQSEDGYIQNPSFEEDDVTALEKDGTRSTGETDGAWAVSELTGWTLTTSNVDVCDLMSAAATATDNSLGVPTAAADGTYWLYLKKTWGDSAGSASVKQTVSLPAGTYMLTVQSMAVAGSATANLVAGDASTAIVINGTTSSTMFSNMEWTTNTLKFTVAEDETEVEIGVEVTFPTGASVGSFLIDNFQLYEVMELTAHEEEYEISSYDETNKNDTPTAATTESFSHWSNSNSTGGSFQLNTWSAYYGTTEPAEPWVEYWVGSGSYLGASTISHETLVGLPAGSYEVSIYANANNESKAAITNSPTLNANGKSLSIVEAAENKVEAYNYYGTYTLECEVGSDGTLDISFDIPASSLNWFLFKDLKVVIVAEKDDYPTVTALTGEMDEEVKDAMDKAIDAYETSPSSDTFHAAIDAIQDAYVAIQKYGTLHECEAEFDHWSIDPSTSSTFQKNTWSTEADPSGMKTPFIEYWKGSGNPLTDAVISHETITGTAGAIYSVSIDYRAFNENSTKVVSQGSTFNANSTSADLCLGTRDVYNGVSEEEYAIGYTILCQANVNTGAIDINFNIQDADFDWFAFKNLVVKAFDPETDEWPELTAATGDMHTGLDDAQTAALASYNTTKSFENYLAAFNAVNAAHLSALFYEDVQETLDELGLDEAGLAKFDELTDGAWSGKTLEYQADMIDIFAEAVKAQTTKGCDMSYALVNSGEWKSSVESLGTYSTGIEAYGGNGVNFTADAYLCKNIEGFEPGATYEVTFDAVASATTWESVVTSGAGITQIYANETVQDITVIQQNSFDNLSDYPHTLTCTVGDDGVLEFGLKNIAAGGNWFVAQAVSLTYYGELVDDDADYAVDDEIDVHNFKGTVASGNLFVNGGFNNGVYGWTAGNGYTDALSEANVTIVEEGGYNGGAYVTLAATGAANATTPTQAIAVEPGKSYLFVGYTNYSGSDTNLPDSRYSALFIMDSKTAERSHKEGDTNYSDGLVELQVVNNGEWVKTEGVFTVPAANEDGTFSYVGMRMNWSTASYDGLQLYEVDGEFTFPEDADYAIGDEVTIDDVTYTVVSDNLVENGSFNDRTTGWTYGNGHAEALYPYNVLYSTDGGYNDGPYITSRGGGSSANTTPSKEVGVKTGKTYLFVGYTNGTAPSSNNEQYNGLFTMTSETAESGDATIQMNWGDPDEGLNGWTKTEDVFTATTDYVGLRFAWCPGACLDGFQIYQIAESEDIVWDMTEAGWGTLILPFAAAVPSGLTAYAGDALTLDSEESTIEVGDAADAIEANVPYLVKGAADTYTFTGAPANTEDSYTVGLLTGTLVDMDYNDFDADGTEYVLQNHEEAEDGEKPEGLAFYPIISGESTSVTLDAYHCYLNTGTAVTALHLPGMATAIEAVESEVIANDAIYDLSGRKVSKVVKGVYIQNGKKVLVK